MSGTQQRYEFTIAGLPNSLTVATGSTAEFVRKKISLYCLEMEDVCYHTGSAILLPEDPAGSKEMSSDNKQQKRVSGIATLALVFRIFEEDPNKRLLIAGHDDTEGKASDGFTISKRRAEGILYLLKGDKAKWAAHANSYHTIKDYQQIMAFFRFDKGWDCDPGKIDGVWGPKTEKAINVFFETINRLGNVKKLCTQVVSSTTTKKWPLEAWEAIYDLYETTLFSHLLGGRWGPQDALKARNRIQFVDNANSFVGCGESFPVDQFGKDNFRSQSNRRVELLFFDKNELPPLPLKCSVQTKNVHTKAECPLHNLAFYIRTYITPDDLNTVLYHLKFEYFDKIRKEICQIPEGLSIKAFKAGQPHIHKCTGKNGLYQIRMLNIPGGIRDVDVHFAFEATNAWIYTKDQNTQPRIVYTFADVDPNLPKAPITRDELAKKPFTERVQYYDLPEKWDSRNWFCSVDQKNGCFGELVKETTTAVAPLTFYLDDIVLVDATDSQELTDCDGEGSSKPLHADYSRVRFLVVDPVSMQLSLFKAKEDDLLFPYSIKYPVDLVNPSDVVTDSTKFCFQKVASGKPKNFVIAPRTNVRAVLFCGSLYDVTNKRTKSYVDFSKGHVLGARSAVRDDIDVHYREQMQADKTNTFIHYPRIGNFDLHYLHEGASDASHDYSFLVVYWSAVINPDTAPIIGGCHEQKPATPEEVAEFKTIGMDNSMNAWNRKGYSCIDAAGINTRSIIKITFIFEAYERFTYQPPLSIDFTDDDYDVLFKRNDFKVALKNCYGGMPKVVAFITCEEKGSWVLSTHSPSRKYGLADLAILDRKENPGYIQGYPFDEFGDTYKGVLAMGHEIGHAIGQVDDYLDKNCYVWDGANWDKIEMPTFQQWGYDDAYNKIASDKLNFLKRVTGSDPWENKFDPFSMMCYMGPVRMRYVWRYVHWVNENGTTLPVFFPKHPLNTFTGGTQFKIMYDRGNMEYYRPPMTKKDPYAFSHAATIKVTDGNEVDIKTTKEKTISVYLYRNLDETRLCRRSTWGIPAPDVIFKSIIVVRIFITIEFLPSAGINWTKVEKGDYAQEIRELFFDDVHAGKNGKYYLTGNGGDNDPTFIHLLPGFEFDTKATIIESSNYHIKVKKNSADPISRVDKVITVGDAISGLKIFNFFFNKPAADAGFNLVPHNDFVFLQQWFCSKFGNGYKVNVL